MSNEQNKSNQQLSKEYAEYVRKTKEDIMFALRGGGVLPIIDIAFLVDFQNGGKLEEQGISYILENQFAQYLAELAAEGKVIEVKEEGKPSTFTLKVAPQTR